VERDIWEVGSEVGVGCRREMRKVVGEGEYVRCGKDIYLRPVCCTPIRISFKFIKY
jgi:hypothetical protein